MPPPKLKNKGLDLTGDEAAEMEERRRMEEEGYGKLIVLSDRPANAWTRVRVGAVARV